MTIMLSFFISIVMFASSVCPSGFTVKQEDYRDMSYDYYSPAIVVNSEYGRTIFELENGNMYEVYGEYSEDYPYLLTMNSIGDEDPVNDIVCVVWQCVEPTLG